MPDVVRVRYAPSPTGFQHMGNLRTALFNWLFARHAGGAFILRIEDTDRERSKEEFVDAILDDFRWLGLAGTRVRTRAARIGPYRQSERLDLYRDLRREAGRRGQGVSAATARARNSTRAATPR